MLMDLDNLVWKTKMKLNDNTDSNSQQNRKGMKYQICETECGICGGPQAEHKLIRLYSCEHHVWDVHSEM